MFATVVEVIQLRLGRVFGSYFSSGVNWVGCEAGHSHPSTGEGQERLDHYLHKHGNARSGCKPDCLHPPVYNWLFCLSIVCHLGPGVYLIIVACGGPVGRGTALQAGRSRVRFPMVVLTFFIYVMLPAA